MFCVVTLLTTKQFVLICSPVKAVQYFTTTSQLKLEYPEIIKSKLAKAPHCHVCADLDQSKDSRLRVLLGAIVVAWQAFCDLGSSCFHIRKQHHLCGVFI